MNLESHFIEIKNSKKIWAIGSIHSHQKSFESVKKYIFDNFKNGDKLIFLGNVIGLGGNSKETLSSIINLRNSLMAKYYLNSEDIIFLRGAQEEMFLKLLQLQTAPNPKDIVLWMYDHGVNKTIESYGYKAQEVLDISEQGTIAISKWTSKLNKTVSMNPGHKEYFYQLKHAAFTSTKKILFLNRGVDVSRPLSAQNDCFWWGYQNFSKLQQPYNSFVRIVRGYQSQQINDLENAKHNIVCTLFKQPLTKETIFAGIFNENAEIIDLFEFK